MAKPYVYIYIYTHTHIVANPYEWGTHFLKLLLVHQTLAQWDGNNAHTDEMSDYVNVQQLPKNLLLLDESQNNSGRHVGWAFFIFKVPRTWHKLRSHGIWMNLRNNLTPFAQNLHLSEVAASTFPSVLGHGRHRMIVVRHSSFLGTNKNQQILRCKLKAWPFFLQVFSSSWWMHSCFP